MSLPHMKPGSAIINVRGRSPSMRFLLLHM